MTIRKIMLVLAGLWAIAGNAQQPAAPRPPYPQNYFRNPVGIPIFLAGNFGECRPNHFHSGIDIKTKGEENEPVYAAADGYVSRIKMESGGFGHGLYITHPNGYTTLYAHLNDFAPAMQQYVHRMQYDKKSWAVDLTLPPTLFPVKQGDLIAYSGNTGGSTAPHLHFEIRNTKTEHPLNPMLFGLPINDAKPPIIKQVAFYTGNVYDGEVLVLPLRKVGAVYQPLKTSKKKVSVVDTLILTPRTTGIAINVDDYMDGSDNQLTFYTADLFVDDSLQARVTLDDVGYDESRYINAYVDYKTRKQKGNWLQCLFQLPGNKLDRLFSFPNGRNGRLDLHSKTDRKVEIVVTDCMGNTSKALFYIDAANDTVPPYGEATRGTPFYANKTNTFSDLNVAFALDERQLYNDFTFTFSKKRMDNMYSERYQLHYPWVPLHHYFDLRIKPIKPIPFNLRGKVVLKYSDGREEEGSAADPGENGYYIARTRNFGAYWLDVDTIPPVIRPLQKNGAILSQAKRIHFTIKDAATAVKKFNASIDGSWVCIEQHGDAFFYTFDDHCGAGKHEMVLKAADENGNEATYTLTFTR